MPRQSYTQTNQQRNLLKTNILQAFYPLFRKNFGDFVRFFAGFLAKLSVFIQDKMQIISCFVFYKR